MVSIYNMWSPILDYSEQEGLRRPPAECRLNPRIPVCYPTYGCDRVGQPPRVLHIQETIPPEDGRALCIRTRPAGPSGRTGNPRGEGHNAQVDGLALERLGLFERPGSHGRVP